MLFDPTTAGRHGIFSSTRDGYATSDEYNWIGMAGDTNTSTESQRQIPVPDDLTLNTLVVYNVTGNGTKTMTMRDAGADSAQSVAVSSSGTATDTDDVTLSQEDLVATEGIRSGGQVWNVVLVGYEAEIEEAAAAGSPWYYYAQHH
jgi:hypothetical protein